MGPSARPTVAVSSRVGQIERPAPLGGVYAVIADILLGPDLGRPHTAPLERGLYEIRAKGREGIARSLYCTVKGQEVVILLTAVKKANKLPAHHMETARKRMKEIHHHD